MNDIELDAKLLTLDEFLATGHGHGWMEFYVEDDETTSELRMPPDIEISLREMVWLGKVFMCIEVPCRDNAIGYIDSHWKDDYGRKVRVWTGGTPPTIEQREAMPWKH